MKNNDYNLFVGIDVSKGKADAAVLAVPELRQLKVNEKDEEIIIFTNLDENEWPTKEVLQLYGNRWSAETGYDILKNKIEMERVTSEKAELIL